MGVISMSDSKYDVLKISNQLCFPLYACSREIIKQYKPFLDEIDLTYTQYIVMMALWEHKTMTVKELGDLLFLDSGTLTPLLKKMEAREYIVRKRSAKDERNLIVSLTKKGDALKDKAVDIPKKMASCNLLSHDESVQLYNLLYKILDSRK